MKTRIVVSKTVRDDLKKLGKKGETYNEILEKIVSTQKEIVDE